MVVLCLLSKPCQKIPSSDILLAYCVMWILHIGDANCSVTSGRILIYCDLKMLISLQCSTADLRLINTPFSPEYLVQILLGHIPILWMQCHFVPWCNTWLWNVILSAVAQLPLAFVTWQLIPLSSTVGSEICSTEGLHLLYPYPICHIAS